MKTDLFQQGNKKLKSLTIKSFYDNIKSSVIIKVNNSFSQFDY